MLNAQVAGYTGKQLENGFVGYICDGPFFLVVSIDVGATNELGTQILDNIKTEILHEHISTLQNFDNLLNSQIFKQNLPAHFSLAAGYLYQDNLFIRTIGNGQIYFRRSKDFALLLSGDKSATGEVKEYDCAVFTTSVIQRVLGEAGDIQLFVDMNAPKDIVEKLQNEEYDEEERGFAVAFAEFLSVAPTTITQQRNLGINPFSDTISEKDPVTAPVILPQSDSQNEVIQKEGNAKKKSFFKLNFAGSKQIALVLSVILFGILLWSVVFGYQRREAARFAKKVEEVSLNVDTNMQKAQKEAFLNMDTSLELIAESKEQIGNLKKESEGRNAKEIEAIEKSIISAESSILKKEEKPYTEFYDLTLEEKSASGNDLNVVGKMVAILDAKNKTIYSLDLEKKSLTQYASADLLESTKVAIYDEIIYFFNPKKGIFKFTTENKVKNVVKVDAEWGSIEDLEIFNGNLYLLDTENNAIYKYVPTEGGYAEKALYLVDETVDLRKATSMAIDSSVYVSNGSTVKKFTRGSEESFETEFPNKSVNLVGIYTDPDIEQVYTWDREKSVIYILGKDGSYNRQIQTAILKNATNIFVREKLLYILAGSKLYTVSIN